MKQTSLVHQNHFPQPQTAYTTRINMEVVSYIAPVTADDHFHFTGLLTRVSTWCSEMAFTNVIRRETAWQGTQLLIVFI